MTIVVACGNPLRSDDGVALEIAAQLPRAPGMEIVTAHMLVPELSARLAQCGTVVFVDARIGQPAGAVACEPLTASDSRSPLLHVGDAASLLAIAESVFGVRPRAFLVTVAAASFELGHGLTDVVRDAIPEAVRRIRQVAIDKV